MGHSENFSVGEAQLMGSLRPTRDAIITIDEQQHIILFNSAAEEMFGYTESEAIGQPLDRLIPKRFQPSHREYVRHISETGTAHQKTGKFGEIFGLRSNGDEFPMETSFLQFELPGKTRLTIILRDITERVEIERDLHTEREFISAVLETAEALVVVLDSQGRIVRFNHACEMLSGYSFEEVQGKIVWDLLLPKEEISGVKHVFQELSPKTQSNQFENRWVTKDNETKLIAWSNTILGNKNGEVEYVIGTGIDITQRKKAESLLEENQRALSTLLNNLSGMAYRCRHDKDWTMEFVSDGSNELCGYRPKELIGKEAMSFGREIIHPEDRQKVWEKISSALKASKSYQLVYRIHTANGSEKWVWEQGCGVSSPTGELVTLEGFITDITARKRAEALLEGENTILASIAMGANLSDTLDQVCLLIEKQCPGIRSSVLILEGSTLRHISSPTMPEGYMQSIDGVTIGPSVGSCGTAAYRREPVIVSDIATDPLWAEYRDLALQHDLQSCWSMPIVSTHDHVLGTFAMYALEARSPLTEELAVIRVATNLAGITIERNQMEKTLKQAQQLAALGTVASGLAHEIGTPMNIILGRAELLKKKTADVLMQKGLTIIVNQIERITKLMNQLLRFARRSPLEPRLVDLRGVLETTIELIHHRADRSDVTVETCYADECQFTQGDPDQLEQVFLNLLTNAIHAMSEGGVLRIDMSLADERTKVTIADTGTGISKEDLSSIFEPFFTTKPIGKGTGLGLMVVKDIIEQHAGSISVVSEPGQGTTFTILLPHHENS